MGAVNPVCLLKEEVLVTQSWPTLHHHNRGQAPLFMENFREEYWSRLPFPPPAQGLISCIDRQALYHQHHLGSLEIRAKGQQR